MPYDPKLHQRTSIRLRGYDYAGPGAYFLTICTAGHRCLFGRIEGDTIRLGPMGGIVEACWRAIPLHVADVELDAFVVMPNHVHGIVWIVDDDRHDKRATHASPLRGPSCGAMAGREVPNGPQRRSVAAVVGSFKSAASRATARAFDRPGGSLWQRNYYEHIIRNDVALARIRQYIADNPARWSQDRENPAAVNPDMADPWLE